MEHADWDPGYRALWEHCRDRPGAVEEHPWGDTVFKVRGRIFAAFGRPDAARVTLKADPDDLDGLLALPFVSRAAYVGRFGWVTVDAGSEGALELALELVDRSHALVSAGRKRRMERPERDGAGDE